MALSISRPLHVPVVATLALPLLPVDCTDGHIDSVGLLNSMSRPSAVAGLFSFPFSIVAYLCTGVYRSIELISSICC
jgi:hypothetical protein